jgi:hypothetical protein
MLCSAAEYAAWYAAAMTVLFMTGFMLIGFRYMYG